MKQYKKYILPALAIGFLSSCADDLTENITVEKPLSVQVMEELNSLDPLKSYKTAPNISKDFKLSGALTATDFISGGNVGALAAANFDEIVAGNAMKYASCVDDDGNMNFGTVQDFVSAAQKAGLSIFGHTLAWHSQQRPKYMQTLFDNRGLEIKQERQKEQEASGNISETETLVHSIDLTKYEGVKGHTITAGEAGDNGIKDGYGNIYNADDKIDYPYYAMGYAPKMTAEGLESKNPGDGAWYQYFILQDITADKKADTKYVAKFKVKSTEDCSVTIQANWGWKEGQSTTFPMSFKQSDDFVEVTKKFDGVTGDKFSLVVQTTTNATFVVKSVEVYVEREPEEAESVQLELVENGDCEAAENKNFIYRYYKQEDIKAEFFDGGKQGKCMKMEVGAMVENPWDNQFFITIPNWEGIIEDGTIVTLEMDVKAATAEKIEVQTHAAPGDYTGGFGNIDATTEWKTFKIKGAMPLSAEKGQSHSLAFNLNTAKNKEAGNTFYFDNVSVSIEKKLPAGDISDDEKKTIATKALRNWIEAMMTATNGYVKAWDVVNEPISGDGNIDGFYTLQHGTANSDGIGGNTDVFFWQDYMGDIDYVRTAVAAAREFYKGNADELKLFINDYNLESDWDDNKKLKSLIYWVEKWEADGVTKIDGLGTQMHISCYEDETTQESKKEHIAKMFELMAATGKLVRVSELDMGYITKDGTSLQTEELTEAQHQQMADLYKFVVKTYLEKVPAAQQYGICQWCLTDSPKSSSWRKGQPTGLWTEKFIRKATFKGFAEGLSGK